MQLNLFETRQPVQETPAPVQETAEELAAKNAMIDKIIAENNEVAMAIHAEMEADRDRFTNQQPTETLDTYLVGWFYEIPAEAQDLELVITDEINNYFSSFGLKIETMEYLPCSPGAITVSGTTTIQAANYAESFINAKQKAREAGIEIRTHFSQIHNNLN